jgi:hypothetical protein
MTLEPLSGELRALAEDPGAFIAIGPDQERIRTDHYSLTFAPGVHCWSASVQRLRFGGGEVAAGVAEVRGLVADRGRTAAAWTVGPRPPRRACWSGWGPWACSPNLMRAR